MRPTALQIAKPHPGYLDVFPFPTMRDKLIELMSSESTLFDEDELWKDIENDGLICWGTAGANGVAAPGGGGAPWDSRSWEAPLWFLTKWSWIVGGEDSELAISSEWWRNMRGVGQGFSFG